MGGLVGREGGGAHLEFEFEAGVASVEGFGGGSHA